MDERPERNFGKPSLDDPFAHREKAGFGPASDGHTNKGLTVRAGGVGLAWTRGKGGDGPWARVFALGPSGVPRVEVGAALAQGARGIASRTRGRGGHWSRGRDRFAPSKQGPASF